MNHADPWAPFFKALESPMEQAGGPPVKDRTKIVGHLLPDVPPEIIFAAGASPVALKGAGVGVSHASAHIPGYTCSHAMGVLELGLTGALSRLDGMVIPYVCDTTRNLFHIWNHCFPDIKNEFLRIPKRMDLKGAEDYLFAEYERLFVSLSELCGQAPDLERLREANALYDKSRARLREAYNLHRTNPAMWTAARVQALVGSFYAADVREHATWLEALPWEDKSGEPVSEHMPVYVRGKVWDPPGLLNLLDELGFVVVGDEIVDGYRCIEQDCGHDENPLRALVARHFKTTPYAGYHLNPEALVTGFVSRVKESGAGSVIFLNPKFCEAAGFDTPDFKKALDELSIPNLILETSARGVSVDQIRLRLEAFKEIIAGDLP
jgi:benzoyl-CoA reductase subunit C